MAADSLGMLSLALMPMSRLLQLPIHVQYKGLHNSLSNSNSIPVLLFPSHSLILYFLTMARELYRIEWLGRFADALEVQAFAADPSPPWFQEMVDDILGDHVPRPQMDFMEDLIIELAQVDSCRYIDRPLTYARNMADHNVIEKLEGFADRQCKAYMRMTRHSFFKLVCMIFEHDAFKTTGYREQEESVVQIAVLLDRLGHNGNGMASARLASIWGRSEGSLSNYSQRAMVALLSLEPRFLSWPTPEERRQHASCAQVVRKGFAGCVGFVDGTTIPLERRPSHCGDFFYDRHGQYSWSAQVVCDIDKRIIFLNLGYTGKTIDRLQNGIIRAAAYFFFLEVGAMTTLFSVDLTCGSTKEITSSQASS